MTELWIVLVPLLEKAPDPNDVKPGWVAFLLFLALAAAVAFLGFSFRKQLRKVNFTESSDDAASSREDGKTNGRGR